MESTMPFDDRASGSPKRDGSLSQAGTSSRYVESGITIVRRGASEEERVSDGVASTTDGEAGPKREEGADRLPEGVQVTRVVSALELREATLEASAAADVLIMSAAVADFRPAEFAEFKIKKSADSEDAPVIQLVRNPDILREVVVRRQQAREAGESTLGPKLIVGFAAETGSAEKTPLELGREKLHRKGTDFLAVNTVGVNRGFGTDDNTITLLSTLND